MSDKNNEPVGIVRKVEGDEVTFELFAPTITDTKGTIWIHPEILKATLISEFLEKIRTWLNTGNKSWYWEAIKSEYEERLPDATGERCEKE